MSRRRTVAAAGLLIAALLAATHAPAQPGSADSTPQSVEEFRALAARILQETGVPGAGIALVRAHGVEWAGGVGLADRARNIPVTEDTPFLAGSISKSFIALGLVQLSEEGLVDLDSPLASILPDLEFDNPWEGTDPVRIIHLLQHTAGFDDMHFREIYNVDGPPDLALEEVLLRSPASRRVRWRPGTRMSYSNPGYGVAGLVLEKIAEQPFEDYVDEHILHPLGMLRSGFRRSADDEAAMARGYAPGSTADVPYPRIYLRPAGGLHTTARDMGAFVQMLLGWGELGTEFIVDPEYLSNMEHPRTSLAFDAGLRYGYGSGMFWWVDAPYAMLGHGGAIDGFTAAYAYSPARDVGVVILLNQSGARAAIERLLSAATRYLKRDVEPTTAPRVEVPATTLASYEGYYHDAAPRNQVFAFLDWLQAGRVITPRDGVLVSSPLTGSPTTLVPVSERLFRGESQVLPTLVLAEDGDGRWVLTGVTSGGAAGVYAERVPRWRVEIVRVPVLASAALLATVALALVAWIVHARRAQPRGFWGLKVTLVTLPLAAAAAPYVMLTTPPAQLAMQNLATSLLFLGTLALPMGSVTAFVLAAGAARAGASRNLTIYAGLIALAGLIVSAYLLWWDLIGFRSWMY